MLFLGIAQLNLGTGSVSTSQASSATTQLSGPYVAPTIKSQPTPQRVMQEWVPGKGFFTPPMITTATQPLIGQHPLSAVPQFPYVYGVAQSDIESDPIPAMQAGGSSTISTNLGFKLPALTLDPTDTATLHVTPNIFLSPVVPGLVISSVQITPQALSSTQGWLPAAGFLQGGQQYQTWRALVTVGLVAVTASRATTLMISLQAALHVNPQ